MILKCPKCNASKNIGAKSRFYICRCDSCNFRFRGIHANLSAFRQILTTLNFFNESDSFLNTEKTACPYCWKTVDLQIAPGKYMGYVSPPVCRWCRKDLPIWGAIQRSDDNLDDWNTVLHWRAVEYAEECQRLREGRVKEGEELVYNKDGTRANVFPPGTFANPGFRSQPDPDPAAAEAKRLQDIIDMVEAQDRAKAKP